jgi:hypothetical protein
MLVNRFVIRRDGVNERRGIPLVLRNALRRLFTHYVEHTALRDAAAFLAAANANQLPPPPNDKVSFITTPRLNQFATYLPTGAPPAQILAANQYFTDWLSVLQSRGYSLTTTDPQWRIQLVLRTGAGGVTLIAWAGTGRIFDYGTVVSESGEGIGTS